jgi:hypothetical protein
MQSDEAVTRRAEILCPDWCSPHRCTAAARVPGAEHRSDPITWRTAYGFYIVSLVQTVRGRVSVELRADVVLDAADPRGRAQRLAVGVDRAVREVVGQASSRPAISRI